MSTYSTKQGDMWDLIADNVYGSTAHTGKLIKANQQYSDIYIFPAGIELDVPDLDDEDVEYSVIPPWRT